MLDLKTPDVDAKKLKQNARIIGLTTIGGFIALLIFFYFFPIQVSVETIEQESRSTIGFDPLALTALKIWNGANLETQTFEIDQCNTAIRLTDFRWEITLNNC